MTSTQTTPALDSKQKRFKGSLTGTLVRTLLIFTLIPLALMAGVAYFRAQNLLRAQAARQSENLIVTQLSVIEQDVESKEARLNHLLDSSDFKILIELAIHANPQSDEFRDIRTGVLKEFENLNNEGDTPAFDQFMLVDTDGKIKVASQANWQGTSLTNAPFLNQDLVENPSFAVFGLAPVYENQFILVTALEYKTSQGSPLGLLVGITETKSFQKLIQPLQSLSPLADSYFILPSGEFIASQPDTGSFSILASPSASQTREIIPLLDELISKKDITPSALEVNSANGEPTLTQVQWSPTMHVGVALEMQTSAVYKELNSLAPFTIGLFIATLLATGILLLFGTNRLIKPLRSLAEITQNYADGDWSKRAPVTGRDEVGHLAYSFNNLADQLSGSYLSLKEKGEERKLQIHTAAEVAQNITSQVSLEDTLDKTVELLVHQFEFYQASIFMMDRSGKNIEIKAAYGAAAKDLMQKKYSLEVGSESIMGWVSQNNQLRIASDVLEDPLHLKNEFLPETRSEASIPISIGSLVLGVLDVQSKLSGAFNPETIAMLQTMASQLASAIQAAELAENTQINFEELSRLYRSSRLIVKARDEAEVLQIGGQVLTDAPHVVALLALLPNKIEAVSASNENGESILDSIPKSVDADSAEINRLLEHGPIIVTSDLNELPFGLRAYTDPLKFISAVFVPVRKNDGLTAIMLLGSETRVISNSLMQPYANFADLVSITLEKIDAEKQTEKHLREVEALISVSEAVSTSSDLQTFFSTLHEKVLQVIGDYSFIVAFYDEKTNSISIPYSYENQQFLSIDPFPLGEGLTSILIRSRQPLLLVGDTERKAAELGAKIQGKPARSWMGAPMLVQNKPVGALIIQDTEKQNAFNEDDFAFFTTMAGQVAGVINNVLLLEESKRRAVQLETAAEIAKDISGSLNLDELLIKAVNLIRERFDFYHSAVFLLDLPKEFAVVREATGDAGAQLKRAGHKIGVGSKSIVGFATGRGELLVVNDTAKDVTYYANPVLPDTRAEAAFPLKVGERILGALDVQSTKPYAFTDENLRSLQILADQMAIAVVNTELFAETQEHLSQHRLLHHITTTVASGTTLEDALESAVSGLQVTLGGDRVTIFLLDRDKKQLEIKAAVGYAEDVAKRIVPVGSGIVGWVASNRKPLRVNDVSEDSRYIQLSSNTKSELAIPLIYRNELLGVLNVESEQVGAYADNDEEMLGTLGGSLAAIIANARLLEQIRLQAERERIVNDVTNRIRRSTDIQSILTTTASELTRITGSKQTKIKIMPEQNDKEGF